MRVRINNNQPNAKQRKALEKECERIFLQNLETYNKKICLQIAYILHFNHKFGIKRLREFFSLLFKMQEKQVERYEILRDDVPDICEIKLREVGITLDDILSDGD